MGANDRDDNDSLGSEEYMTIPVFGNPDPADPAQRLPVVGDRGVYVPREKFARDDRLAMIKLEEDPLTGSEHEPWISDLYYIYFIFKLTKEAAPGDAVVVLHEQNLAVRKYEPQGNGQVCLRSVEPKCPTWVLPAGEVNLQGVVIMRYLRPNDMGWA